MNSYLYVRVIGKNINRFLLKCNKNHINILKVENESYKSAVILIKYKDYDKLKKIKSLYKIKIIKSTGLTKYKSLLFKYKTLIISFIISIIVLLILSNTIFIVSVEGENNNLNSLLKKELVNYEIERFKFKKSYDEIERIKNKIKEKYKDNIEWIEIKNIGVKYVVKYVERKIDKKNSSNEIYSIVASKSGVIKGIYTTKGISLVEVGDYVNKGDILISSDLILNDEIKDRVSSIGKVYAECWYKVNVEYPLHYVEKKYTNNKRKLLYIKVGNKYIDLFKYKNYERKKIFTYEDKISGIEFGIEELKEVNLINKKYDTKTAIDIAIKEAKNKLLDTLDEDERITYQKTLKFYNNGSKIVLDIFFSVYEEIGERKVIEVGE